MQRLESERCSLVVAASYVHRRDVLWVFSCLQGGRKRELLWQQQGVGPLGGNAVCHTCNLF